MTSLIVRLKQKHYCFFISSTFSSIVSIIGGTVINILLVTVVVLVAPWAAFAIAAEEVAESVAEGPGLGVTEEVSQVAT